MRGLSSQARAAARTVRVSHGALLGEEPPRDRLSSVARALEALEVVASAAAPLPAKAVARRLGTSVGTAYHILHTLEHSGYVVRLAHGRFGLGPTVAGLQRAFGERIDLVPVVRPHLDELARRAREDAYLAVLREDEIVIADVVTASADLHVGGLEVGFTRLAHATAIGKVLLAAASEDFVTGYLGERALVPFTPRTLVAPRHILRHLRIVHERGVGHDLQELVDGCCCVAVPVLDAAGQTAGAIGVSTTTARWARERAGLTELCCEIGAACANALAGATATAPAARPRAG